MKSEFSRFLFRKMQEFEREQGRRVSLREFADYLGVSRPTLSQWLDDKREPSIRMVGLLTAKLGREVLEIYGIVDPNELLASMDEGWDRIPETTRNQVRDLVQPYVVIRPKRGNTDGPSKNTAGAGSESE